jgi:hypothetical protein
MTSLFLITPPEKRGGDDLDMLIAAEQPVEACRMFIERFAGEAVDCEFVQAEDIAFGDCWCVRQLEIGPLTNGIVAWDQVPVTFWREVPKLSLAETKDESWTQFCGRLCGLGDQFMEDWLETADKDTRPDAEQRAPEWEKAKATMLASVKLVEQMSRFTDPLDSEDPGDELCAFGRCIDSAKEIVGDLSESEDADEESTEQVLVDALNKAVDFIENCTDDDPERTTKFFAAREAWREAFAKARK